MSIKASTFARLTELVDFINANSITQTQIQLLHHIDNTGGYVLVWWE